MAQVTNFFAGANSGSGFRNLFPELLDLENARDVLVLKGGPGTGKNSLMKKLGRAMEQAGTTVEYLWCSGDPDSLDGVVLPDIRCAVVDGTAPHTLEPRYPLAVDRCVDLGRFCDVAGVKTVADEVRRLTRTYRAAYAAACQSLHAARAVEQENVAGAAEAMDHQHLERRVKGIADREMRRGGPEAGTVARRFLGGITHRGYVWRFDTVDRLCPRVYEFSDSWERTGEAFAILTQTAQHRGWNTIACMAPEEPQRIEHLLIPGLGLAFVTSRRGMDYGRKPFRRIRADAMGEPEQKNRMRFSTKMAAELRKDGVRSLQEAKTGHDALEAVLRPFMNYEGVDELTELETNRLLGYLP